MRTIAGNGGGQVQLPLPETLSACRTTAFTEGFKDTFSLTPRGLYSINTSRYFRPEQITVHRTLNISGNENTTENATLYVIETADGVKGTLTDPGGPGGLTSGFISEAETICRQMNGLGRNEC